MNQYQFKAWIEGFAEAVGEAPTPEQWKIVLEKAKTIGDLIDMTSNDFDRDNRSTSDVKLYDLRADHAVMTRDGLRFADKYADAKKSAEMIYGIRQDG